MELTVNLNHGPIDVEFTGEDREEVEENLLHFIEFLEENQESIAGIDLPDNGNNSEETPELDSDYWEEQQEESESTTQNNLGDSSVSYGSIPNRTGIDEAKLAEYFAVDPESEEPPYLNFDPEVLGEDGNSRSEKQMRGCLILLTLWNEVNETEECGSSELKDALRISAIDDTNLYNMYRFNDDEGDRYFNREGSGGNTDISLTMAGKREGYDQIARTVERLEGDIEE